MPARKARSPRSPREKLIARILREGTVSHECEPEHIPYRGNCSAIDPATDREQEAWVRDQLERGNEWAWCSVRTELEWRGRKAVCYLGGCSYLSHADFVKCEGDTQAREAAGQMVDAMIVEYNTTPSVLAKLATLERLLKGIV